MEDENKVKTVFRAIIIFLIIAIIIIIGIQIYNNWQNITI